MTAPDDESASELVSTDGPGMREERREHIGSAGTRQQRSKHLIANPFGWTSSQAKEFLRHRQEPRCGRGHQEMARSIALADSPFRSGLGVRLWRRIDRGSFLEQRLQFKWIARTAQLLVVEFHPDMQAGDSAGDGSLSVADLHAAAPREIESVQFAKFLEGHGACFCGRPCARNSSLRPACEIYRQIDEFKQPCFLDARI